MPKVQALLQLLRAPKQRHHFLGRVLHQLQVRRDQLQRQPQVLQCLAVLIEERRVVLERHAPFRLAEQQEELLRAIVQRVQHPIQLARSKLLGPRNQRDIAPQLLELVVAHSHAEIFPGHILDLVRLVEHHRGVIRDDAAEVLVLHRQVGEEQVMIHDDDVALVRAPVHFREKAALELLALLAGA